MQDQRRSSFGGLGAWAIFATCCTVIGLGATFRWRALDIAFALTWLSFLIFGSLLFLWRASKARAHGVPAPLGQAAALPASWRRWIFGSSPRSSGK
jgi:hypothetical protein